MSFNTIDCDIKCPHCNQKIESGIGFRFGFLNQDIYKIGDQISWEGNDLRPEMRPAQSVIKTLGHFNCDNLECSTWQDCFPDVQTALITIENNHIKEVSIYTCQGGEEEFAIIN